MIGFAIGVVVAGAMDIIYKEYSYIKTLRSYEEKMKLQPTECIPDKSRVPGLKIFSEPKVEDAVRRTEAHA